MRIAIYDLDRTLTAQPTFTPFLVFSGRRLAPWRLALLPMWVTAMLGYRLGLYSRTALKRFGMRLMLGRHARGDLRALGEAFAAHHIARSGWREDVLALLAEDREAGATFVIATAAFGFYAQAFARELGIDHVIATEWDGEAIPGGNCYGAEKARRVRDWLVTLGIARQEATISMASDSFVDAPLLDWADEAVFVTDSPREAVKAKARGWRVVGRD